MTHSNGLGQAPTSETAPPARTQRFTREHLVWVLVYLACPVVGGVTVALWAGIWAGIAVHVVLAAALTAAIAMIRFAGRAPRRRVE